MEPRTSRRSAPRTVVSVAVARTSTIVVGEVIVLAGADPMRVALSLAVLAALGLAAHGGPVQAQELVFFEGNN